MGEGKQVEITQKSNVNIHKKASVVVGVLLSEGCGIGLDCSIYEPVRKVFMNNGR